MFISVILTISIIKPELYLDKSILDSFICQITQMKIKRNETYLISAFAIFNTNVFANFFWNGNRFNLFLWRGFNLLSLIKYQTTVILQAYLKYNSGNDFRENDLFL